jgi:hypothetical protein
MDDRSIVRVTYIQNHSIENMKSMIKHDDSTYDYSGLFIDDEDF